MNFSLFRLPNTQQFYRASHQDGASSVLSFFGFDKSAQDFACHSFEEISLAQAMAFLQNLTLSQAAQAIQTPTQAQYLQKVEATKSWLQEHNIAKLVISRPKALPQKTIAFDILFKALCKDFPQTFCYAYYNNGVLWMGATPELLGHYNKQNNLFSTMSLAGTLPSQKAWTNKEIQEQAVVSQYIAQTLGDYAQNVKISDTFSHHSGNIKHLRNDFTALCNARDVEHLIEALHPTPAICGIPKALCLPQILRTENYHRDLYAGIIKIEMPHDLYYFVNLRCAKFTAQQALVYAGGGINHLSDPKTEWEETELKSQVFGLRI